MWYISRYSIQNVKGRRDGVVELSDGCVKEGKGGMGREVFLYLEERKLGWVGDGAVVGGAWRG